MVKEDKSAWKANYFVKLVEMLEEYPKCFLVGVDNVGSKQMQQIRQSLRDRAAVLMGKNTMMRKAIRGHLEKNPALERLLPYIKGNVGFVFTKEELIEIRDLIVGNVVPAQAKAGTVAQCDVKIPPQNTSLGPEKTSFFQALSIPTKIARGTIEILNEVHLIHEGDKVGASEATLLNMLNITPFTYGLQLHQVYENGSVFHPSILDITPTQIRERFMMGVTNVASLSLAISYPNVVSVPHMIANAFKNLLAVAVTTEYTFPEAETVVEFVKDPSKFATAAAPAAASAGKGDDKKAKEPEPEEEEEEEEEGFGGLFD